MARAKPEETKHCTRCDSELLLSSFGLIKNKPRPWCKKCCSLASMASRKKCRKSDKAVVPETTEPKANQVSLSEAA